ncbi:MAG: alanine--glyoxylate aminotransferase family protein [Pseudomonadota bacterium]
MNVPRLFTPGPTPVPESVRKAGAQPMIHHRSEEFGEILRSVRRSLNVLCDTDGEALVLSSSGSGGMEACVSSLFSPGDEVVVVEAGKFGERWVELASHYHLKADVIRVPWGSAVRPEEVARAVNPSTRGVLVQACESSTGVFHPVDRIGRLLPPRDDLLFVVDAITALGVHDLSMKRDRIDSLVGASQKAFMCPPGLATVSLGLRALVRLGRTQPQGYYFSLQRELAAQQKGFTAFTPAVSLVRSLAVALDLILKTDTAERIRRQRGLQAMARTALREDGLSLFNRDEDATWGITVAETPKGVDAKSWLKELKVKYGLWLAGGQSQLEGKIFRMAHLGAIGPKDLLWAIETIEGSLAGQYPNAKSNSGLKKAREIYEDLGL